MEEKIFEKINAKSDKFARDQAEAQKNDFIRLVKRMEFLQKRNKIYNSASHLMFVVAGGCLLGFLQYFYIAYFDKAIISACLFFVCAIAGKVLEK